MPHCTHDGLGCIFVFLILVAFALFYGTSSQANAQIAGVGGTNPSGTIPPGEPFHHPLSTPRKAKFAFYIWHRFQPIGPQPKLTSARRSAIQYLG
ncbi:MAG: hypothetical protein R2867_02365 [Caldilineaceae bacterium]